MRRLRLLGRYCNSGRQADMENVSNIRIANRDDAICVISSVMEWLMADSDRFWLETECGNGSAADCLDALKDAIERHTV